VSSTPVLKAGGAYVPLDPSYPCERLAFILGDSGARLLLTDSRLLECLAVDQLPAICLDTDPTLLSEGQTDNPESDVAENNFAYMIYTSGSTGHPKGCQIEHSNLMNYLNWDCRFFTVMAKAVPLVCSLLLPFILR
jgi:non-ribosomal peptide synthetase component F